jgi:hypothetical protein
MQKNVFLSRGDFSRWALDVTIILETSNRTGEKIRDMWLINT